MGHLVCEYIFSVTEPQNVYILRDHCIFVWNSVHRQEKLEGGHAENKLSWEDVDTRPGQTLGVS